MSQYWTTAGEVKGREGVMGPQDTTQNNVPLYQSKVPSKCFAGILMYSLDGRI